MPSISVQTRFVTQPVTRRAIQALATGILLTTPLHAADIQWTGGDGNFTDTASWSGGVLPGGGDTAVVSNGGSVWINTAPPTLGGVRVSSGGFGTEVGMTNTGSTIVGNLTGSLGRFDFKTGMFMAMGQISIGTGGGNGLFVMENGMIQRMGGGTFSIGDGAGSEGELVQSSGFIRCVTPWHIGVGANAKGTLDFSGQSAANAIDMLIVGADGGTGTMKLGAGSFNKVVEEVQGTSAVFGRGNGSSAIVQQTGGYFTNGSTDTLLGESGNATATWTISGEASIAYFGTLVMGNADSASATFNLNGGTLNPSRIIKGGSTGNTAIVFNGGTLKPRFSDADFISGIDSLTVEDGGLFVDTDTHSIGIGLNLLDGGGGLTKRNGGTLSLEASSQYTGATVVEGGTLLINGTLTASEVTVQADGTIGGSGTINKSITSTGTIAPGYGVGTLTVKEDVAVAGKLAIELTPAGSDVLVVEGDLNVEGATLRIELPEGEPLTEPYVIATYGTRSGGNFAGIENGAGYTIDYAYQGNKIAVTPGTSPYANWASNYTWASDEDKLPEADPDGDGFANILEFFLDGDPLVSGQPVGKPSGRVVGDRFVFTFERNAGAASIAPVVEYGTGLDLPLVAVDGQDGVIITTEPGPGGDSWTVSIPMPPGGKLFARLKVEVDS
ncbi:autotransporter-associated beta strand repeat-containing protein [Luteolibacter flavescens]|uniref:Autotransporter-associated beta strand repeat-containing protein n=1 Tax=Luteolibacter flavescens TaxID=1859460 RepID=A0ABT3FM60_9BACT|nr:autotransporter-associated beta strand repeat-containing protein [Luteolibacter flavescens]MCW1884667.1 autotransporter-associated beta strand repeat-containing protein [Luteolibacter flavescens]